jgi:Carboxypeptidase regulatory-like domain
MTGRRSIGAGAMLFFVACHHQLSSTGCSPAPPLGPVIRVSEPGPAGVLAVLTLDAHTNQPLAGARVHVPSLGISVTTDSTGVGRLSGLEPGTYGIAAAAVGYAKRVDSVVIGPNAGRFVIEQLPLSQICEADSKLAD